MTGAVEPTPRPARAELRHRTGHRSKPNQGEQEPTPTPTPADLQPYTPEGYMPEGVAPTPADLQPYPATDLRASSSIIC